MVKKTGFFWSRPKIFGQPDIFNCFTCFLAENINVPSRHTQKWHWNGLNIKKCHETTKITFDSYYETPCIKGGWATQKYLSVYVPSQAGTDGRGWRKRWCWVLSTNCKPISIQTASSTLFKSRQRLQTCINQYNLVLQIWLQSNSSKLTKVLPQPIGQPGHPPPRLHQQRPVEAGRCIYMTQCRML